MPNDWEVRKKLPKNAELKHNPPLILNTPVQYCPSCDARINDQGECRCT